VLDFAFACAIVPMKTVCIAKRSFMYDPFLGLFWWAANQIFIDRSSRSDALSTLEVAKNRIVGQKHSVWIFPEGTRNDKGIKLLPFKKGAFHLAIQAGVPIVATVFAPLQTTIDLKHQEWKGGVFRMKVLPPFPTKGLTTADVDQLIEKVHASMQAQLDEFTEIAIKNKQL